MRLVRSRSKFIKQQVELKLRDRERCREDLKAHHPLVEGASQFQPKSVFIPFALQLGRDTSGDLQEVSARATAGIENDNLGIGQPARASKLCLQQVVNALDLIADDFGRRVPDTQIVP